MPVALVLGAIVAGLQAFVLKAALHGARRERRNYDKLVTQVQKQVEGARKSAIYDPNLGLYQRWYLETRLKQEIARSRRYGLSLALIVVRFEQRGAARLTDTEWQAQAVEAARTLGTGVRNVDLAAIIGEREFADLAGALRAPGRRNRHGAPLAGPRRALRFQDGPHRLPRRRC